VEALLRWTDPDLGEQHPADFIPIAESTDLIMQIGDWVIETACRQAVAWRDAGTPLRVAVNLSARQFRDDGLDDRIRATLTRQGLEPELFELEITESEAMVNPKRTGQLLKRLQGFGVAVALDDFGTGHSSLAYLRELPVTRLKIDREFIRPIGEPGTEATLVKAILGLASTLGLDVVAEGVETQAQLDFLRANGCGAYQGWLFAKALPADQVPALLRRRP
jgi:EAL domain-containing protein (putative c-di-GMP-specific phosphodiesterase class I)